MVQQNQFYRLRRLVRRALKIVVQDITSEPLQNRIISKLIEIRDQINDVEESNEKTDS